MKTTTTILAAVLALSINVLFAGNDGAAMINELNTVSISLAPVVPTEATFEEMTTEATAVVTFAPVAPAEADFSDEASEEMFDITALAPVTPAEADFTLEDDTVNNSALAPLTPSVADFTDGI